MSRKSKNAEHAYTHYLSCTTLVAAREECVAQCNSKWHYGTWVRWCKEFSWDTRKAQYVRERDEARQAQRDVDFRDFQDRMTLLTRDMLTVFEEAIGGRTMPVNDFKEVARALKPIFEWLYPVLPDKQGELTVDEVDDMYGSG